MGGHTTACLEASDDAIAKVQHFLANGKRESWYAEKDSFNEAHNMNPGDGDCEWSITGPNHMNNVMVDRITQAIVALKVDGTLRIDGDVNVYNTIYEGGEVKTSKKPAFTPVDLNGRYGSMPYKSTEDSGVTMSDDFQAIKGHDERSVNKAAWDAIDSDGMFTQYVENMKEISAMIKRGTVTIEDVMCEDEDERMDIRIGPKNDIQDRFWEGEADGSESEGDSDGEDDRNGKNSDEGGSSDDDGENAEPDGMLGETKKRRLSFPPLSEKPTAGHSEGALKRQKTQEKTIQRKSPRLLSAPSSTTHSKSRNLSSLTADKIAAFSRRDLQKYCMESKCCKGNATNAKMVEALLKFIQR